MSDFHPACNRKQFRFAEIHGGTARSCCCGFLCMEIKSGTWAGSSDRPEKKQKSLQVMKTLQAFDSIGAGARNRTGMPLRAEDFESSASTSFTTPARARLYRRKAKSQAENLLTAGEGHVKGQANLLGIYWGCSSAGRALEWHSRGQEFDPPQLHQNIKREEPAFFPFLSSSPGPFPNSPGREPQNYFLSLMDTEASRL